MIKLETDITPIIHKTGVMFSYYNFNFIAPNQPAI